MRRDWVRLSPHSPDEAAILSTEARFRAVISRFRSYAGRLPYRELDHALSLTDTGADVLTGRNGRRLLVGLLAPSVFGRLAGHEDVNDANRLYHDPAVSTGWSTIVRRWVSSKGRSWPQSLKPAGNLANVGVEGPHHCLCLVK